MKKYFLLIVIFILYSISVDASCSKGNGIERKELIIKMEKNYQYDMLKNIKNNKKTEIPRGLRIYEKTILELMEDVIKKGVKYYFDWLFCFIL